MNPNDMIAKLTLSILIFSLWTSGAAVAQEITPTPTATETETPTATPLPTHTLTLFRDADSLTLLVPASGNTVSLAGIELRVTLLDGQTIARRMDRDYTAFLGIPFERVDALGAVCFRLVRSGGSGPIPIECGSGPLLLTQQLAAADVFWYDSSASLPRIVQIWQDGAFVALCPAAQDACPITLTLLPVAPTPTPTVTPTTAEEMSTLTLTPISVPTQVAASPTPGYPCEGTIIFNNNASLNVVRAGPTSLSSSLPPIHQGIKVIILSKVQENLNNLWYQIANEEGKRIGWIPVRYVISSNCPT